MENQASLQKLKQPDDKEVSILTTSIFVRSVITIPLVVTELAPLDAVAVSAGQVVLLAQGRVREEQGLHFLLPGLCVAVANGVLPIASLLLNVERQAGRATDGLETLERKSNQYPFFYFTALR